MESNKISGTTVVAAIVPGTTADTYPTHLAEYGKGGWRSVSSFEALSTIASGRIENGMVAYVLDQNKPYIYLNGWEELELGTKIQGIFHFKGIAESVSPDLSYIVVCTASTDGRETSPIGAFADLKGEIYYGWENENGDTFYTDSLVLNNLTKQYEKGSDTYEMRSLEYNGDVYYLKTDSPPGYQAYENVSGETIYLDSGYVPFSNGACVGVVNENEQDLGTAIGCVYNAYTFTESIQPITIAHSHTVITASSDNSGHVYQIGENEYASNGQIWVKLGAPVEDWIIL